ncbi:hypothetical protein CHS0354_011461 [Potamilus streckersoni]|uniref:SAND domain-containing protein n=1 Tax=Potamilus streckersoni TaxID=2493646 RepID=A0AAE0SLY4_9BIVA|nr:hypothetical protein CHS0354_011461 [Potamilus streckersoni]
MSDVEISEDLPNGDDSAFADEHQHTTDQAESSDENNTTETTIVTEQPVFVATTQGLLAPEHFQDAIKTTHIVIHDQTLESGLKTPTTPLPPPTPATPLSREKGFRYQWDESVHAEVLPVRCKNLNGELHKCKFGSGGRGRCIKSGDKWYTPNEFENEGGRASSKDWKRSIRYGGRTLQCLIEDGILQAHATSCTCAACCDDESVTGPVRLFVPYKRRKKDSESGPGSPSAKKIRVGPPKSPGPTGVTSPMQKEGFAISAEGMVSLAGAAVVAAHPLRVTNAINGETVQIVTTDAAGNLVAGDAVVMTPIPITTAKGHTATVCMDVGEQKQWWQLEEMVNSLIQQAQQLKLMIEQAKHQSLIAKETSLQALRAQMEKEKQESLSTARIEAQMHLSRAIMEERAQKDIAIQQALAQARAEMNEKTGSVTVVTYENGWVTQSTDMMSEMTEESDKEKE